MQKYDLEFGLDHNLWCVLEQIKTVESVSLDSDSVSRANGLIYCDGTRDQTRFCTHEFVIRRGATCKHHIFMCTFCLLKRKSRNVHQMAAHVC